MRIRPKPGQPHGDPFLAGTTTRKPVATSLFFNTLPLESASKKNTTVLLTKLVSMDVMARPASNDTKHKSKPTLIRGITLLLFTARRRVSRMNTNLSMLTQSLTTQWYHPISSRVKQLHLARTRATRKLHPGAGTWFSTITDPLIHC
jgi:hypothetical protein